MNFEDARNEYYKARKEEYENLKEYLKGENFVIKEGGNSGHGVEDYTANGKLKKSYNLTNWLWIDVEYNGKKFLISFQPPVKNEKSQNDVVLFDRIGIFEYNNEEPYYNSVLNEIKITNIDLPLNESKKNEIKRILLDRSNKS